MRRKVNSYGASGPKKKKQVELKTKGVVFNIRDIDQLKMYRHCLEKSNFSSYIKGLIMKDMWGANNDR